MQIDQLYRDLLDRLPAMVDELSTYVTIESGSHDKEGVDQVGREVSRAFADLGFSVDRIAQETCGDHLVARRRGGGSGRLLALIHLDTVWPRGTLAENPFRVDDGRAYGPGVLDMKGGWVVLLSALRALVAANWDGLAQTTVFMTGDEELGSPTGRSWIEREAAEADWAFVLEPARENGALVVNRGMVGALYLDVRGVTAHAAFGDRGASAIEEIARKILELRALSDPDHEVFVNIGTLTGGSARQVVPDRASASIDVRAPNAERTDAVMARIKDVVDHTHVAGTESSLRGGITRPAFKPSPEGERLFRRAQEVARELGLHIEDAATPAGSDGNFTAAMGVPTLDGLGPEGANACSREEYVVVESLPRRAALLAGVIAGLPALGPERGSQATPSG